MALAWPKSIQILALKEVISKHPSSEFDLRSIARWYSKTFATPLHLVYTLSTFDVLQAYFEEIYEELSKTEEGEIELKRIAVELSKSEEELELEKRAKDKDDVYAYKVERDCVKDNRKIDSEALKEKQKEAKQKLERDKRAAKALDRALDQDSLNSKITLESPTALPEKEPVEFKVDFSGLNDIGDLDSLSSLTGLK